MSLNQKVPGIAVRGGSPDGRFSSFIIITRDRLEDLMRCLQSVAQQTVLPAEVVIVDAGSDPRVHPAARDLLVALGIRVVYLRSEPGTSRQRNVGIQHASGDLLFFLDDDVVPERDYHAALLDAYRRLDGRPVGGVQGTITNVRQLKLWTELFCRLFLLRYPIRRGKARMLPSGHCTWYQVPPDLVEVETMSSGCCSYRREALREFQFDEALGGYGLKEDIDLSYRISRRWPLFHTQHARLRHNFSSAGRPTLREFSRKRIAHTVYVWRKNLPHSAPHALALGWSLVGHVLLAIAQSVRMRTWDPLLGTAEGFLAALHQPPPADAISADKYRPGQWGKQPTVPK